MSEVILQIYDITQGMARMMSMALIGKQIDGIWHTSVVLYGREYYFGGGICVDVPLTTPYGTPVEKINLGRTTKSQVEFERFLRSISSRFTPEAYHIVNHNCNNFTDECVRFLLDKRIPSHITGLPSELLSTPLGQQFGPMLNSMMLMKNDMFPIGSSQVIDHWQDYATHEDYFPEFAKVENYTQYDELLKDFAVIVFWDPRNDESMSLLGTVQGTKCKVAFCDCLRYFYLAPATVPSIRVVSHGEIVCDYAAQDYCCELVNEMFSG